LGVVVVTVPKNKLRYYEPLFPNLRRALEEIQPGQLIHVAGR